MESLSAVKEPCNPVMTSTPPPGSEGNEDLSKILTTFV